MIFFIFPLCESDFRKLLFQSITHILRISSKTYQLGRSRYIFLDTVFEIVIVVKFQTCSDNNDATWECSSIEILQVK